MVLLKSLEGKITTDVEEEAFKEKDGFAAFVQKSLEDSEHGTELLRTIRMK